MADSWARLTAFEEFLSVCQVNYRVCVLLVSLEQPCGVYHNEGHLIIDEAVYVIIELCMFDVILCINIIIMLFNVSHDVSYD